LALSRKKRLANYKKGGEIMSSNLEELEEKDGIPLPLNFNHESWLDQVVEEAMESEYMVERKIAELKEVIKRLEARIEQRPALKEGLQGGIKALEFGIKGIRLKHLLRCLDLKFSYVLSEVKEPYPGFFESVGVNTLKPEGPLKRGKSHLYLVR
jgi:hypothetical protein